MRITDEAAWQAQLAEFAAQTNPNAGHLRNFVIAWAEAAEQLVDHDTSPIEALRTTLRTIEKTYGRQTTLQLGTALMVLTTHWAPAAGDDRGESFYLALTSIEQNMYLDVASVHYKAQEEAAKNVPTGPPGGRG
jgi:hypothetical protein